MLELSRSRMHVFFQEEQFIDLRNVLLVLISGGLKTLSFFEGNIVLQGMSDY